MRRQSDAEELYFNWRKSRQGARSGRGFHFQDAVGAWLFARLASPGFKSTALVPEGLDDCSLEGVIPTHIQIKSRARHLGRFPVAEASRHVIESWIKHAIRPDECQAFALVFENGVEHIETSNEFGQTAGEFASEGTHFRTVLLSAAAKQGLSDDEFATMLESTYLLSTNWDELTSATAAEIAKLVDLPPQSLTLIARQLRTIVADASDANGNRDYGDRFRLTKTDLVSHVESISRQIDADSLQAAISDGICEALSFRQVPEDEGNFYEGVATQPGHVGRGLVVPRPDLMDGVLNEIDERSAVIITGPSGIGKSAILWTVPLALPGVTWFRVRRLGIADADKLLNLARAFEASPKSPVGFLVDDAGARGSIGWDYLRTEAAAVPGVLLIATARSEDLKTLGDISNCGIVEVKLDETAAEVIFDGLSRRNATNFSHWQEAFETSRGLTLEFTHILTRGRRLGEVLSEQVHRRVNESRFHELEILKLVSVAEMCSASLTTTSLKSACGLSDWELRKALERLAEEHLVVERDGSITGMHPIRSIAIAAVIHELPPPKLIETLDELIGLVPVEQLCGFVVGALRNAPDAGETIIDAAAGEFTQLGRFTQILRGLRLFDFYETADRWVAIADDCQVPESVRPTLFCFTAAGVSFPELMPTPLRNAQSLMQDVRVPSLREELVSKIGDNVLATRLASTSDVDTAIELLGTLDSSGEEFAFAVEQQLGNQSPLILALQSAKFEQRKELLAVARACNPAIAMLLVDELGGVDRILDRLREENPWVTELEITEIQGEAVARARFLHVSDAVQGDPQKVAVALGQTLLRLLPLIESVDVKALAPGGHEIQIPNFTYGVSRLRRQYDHSESGMSWNLERVRAVLTLLGDTETNRLATALPLFKQALKLTEKIAVLNLAGKSTGPKPSQLNRQRERLNQAAFALKPPLSPIEGGVANIESQPSLRTDPLSALITDLTGNVLPRLRDADQYRAIAAYLAGTVLSNHLEGAIDQPWHFVGMQTHPGSLTQLRKLLIDLHAVVLELATPLNSAAVHSQLARLGAGQNALNRTADWCRRRFRERIDRRRKELQELCSSAGVDSEISHKYEIRSSSSEFLIAIKLESLLEWTDKIASLEVALKRDKPSEESYLLVPVRSSRSVPALAVKLITNLHRAAGVEDWLAELPEPAPSELSQILLNAHACLQTISGILDLSEQQQGIDAIQLIVQMAVDDFNAARQRMNEYPTDAVIDQLLAFVDFHAAQVRKETSGGEPPGGRIAEQITRGILRDEPTDAISELAFANLLALEWEIDPSVALGFLSSPN